MPIRLYYFLVALALTGTLASIEASTSPSLQAHIERQNETYTTILDHVGLAHLMQ